MTIAEVQRFLVSHCLSIRITVDRDERTQVRFYKGRTAIAMGDGRGISRALTEAVRDYRYIHSQAAGQAPGEKLADLVYGAKK